jgi:D-beta-D-heptose 7-phosphate kinase/D-beta-D-heptose 1-phosphate adenosyltransferase
MRKTIIVTGCFDILHVGHISLFQFCKDNFPEYELRVFLDSDERVAKSKGKGRPINNQEDRKKMLESLRWVDYVAIFDTDKDLEYFCKDAKGLRVVGSDYVGKEIIGKKYFSAIIYFDRFKDYSTTNIIQKLYENTIDS